MQDFKMQIKRKIANWLSKYSRHRKYLLFKNCLKHNPCTILDIGCGKGDFMERFISFDTEYRYLLRSIIALDMRGEYIHELKRNFEVDKVVIGDACNLSFKNSSVDMVISNALLEHLPKEEQQRFADEIRRVAKDYCIICPSKFSLFEVHYYLPFIGWLNPKVRDKIIRFIGISLHNDPINLVSFSEFRKLFYDASELYRMNIFGLFEHLIAIKTDNFTN